MVRILGQVQGDGCTPRSITQNGKLGRHGKDFLFGWRFFSIIEARRSDGTPTGALGCLPVVARGWRLDCPSPERERRVPATCRSRSGLGKTEMPKLAGRPCR